MIACTTFRQSIQRGSRGGKEKITVSKARTTTSQQFQKKKVINLKSRQKLTFFRYRNFSVLYTALHSVVLRWFLVKGKLRFWVM